MYVDSQNEASESYSFKASARPPSTCGTPRPSISQGGLFTSTLDRNSSKVNNLNDPSLDTQDKLAHLTLTSTGKDYDYEPNSERARRLKALPTCERVRNLGLKAMENWAKSFETTEQTPFFEDLAPLEALKNKANSDLIQQLFGALVEYSAGVKTCYEEFQILRKPFDDLASAEHLTVDEQVNAILKLGGELVKNKLALGKNVNIILESRHHLWKFQDGPIQETLNMIESGVSVDHDPHGDIQFALDLLKDEEHLLHQSKEPSGFVGTVLVVAGKCRSFLASKMYRNKKQGSKMLQDMYQEEKSKVDAMHQQLNESASVMESVKTALNNLRPEIYTDIFVVIDRIKLNDSQVSYVAAAKKLDVAEGNLLTFMDLLEDFLAQITQEYGVKFGTREAKKLCSRLPNIFAALAMLLSAKEVVVDDKQSMYEEHIYELSEDISEHFEIMEGIHWECRDAVNIDRQTAFLRDDVPRFKKAVSPHLQGIKDIADTHISKAKSKEAYNKRAKQDRLCGNSSLTRRGRPLATGEEMLWALRKVVDALLLIGAVAGGSTTFDKDAVGNTNCTTVAAANDSLPWFKMSGRMKDEFHAVLYGEFRKLGSLKCKK